jgi:hypothetical protein
LKPGKKYLFGRIKQAGGKSMKSKFTNLVELEADDF